MEQLQKSIWLANGKARSLIELPGLGVSREGFVPEETKKFHPTSVIPDAGGDDTSACGERTHLFNGGLGIREEVEGEQRTRTSVATRAAWK